MSDLAFFYMNLSGTEMMWIVFNFYSIYISRMNNLYQ